MWLSFFSNVKRSEHFGECTFFSFLLCVSVVDIADLYSQGVDATVEKSDVSEDTAAAASYR